MGKVKQALEEDMMLNPENYNNPTKEEMCSSSQQNNWEKGFNILMEYWDCLPDDEKPKIHKQLEELNL